MRPLSRPALPAVIESLLPNGYGASMEKATNNLTHKLTGIAWIAFACFIGAALVTYDPADSLPSPMPPLDRIYQPDQLVEPVNAAANNACGLVGAVAADLLLVFMGFGAHLLVATLIWLGWKRLKSISSGSPRIQMAGWILTLLGACGLSSLVIPHWSAGPVIGAGGYIGALEVAVLRQHFALTGAAIVLSSCFIAGVLLFVDETILEPLRPAAALIRRAALRAVPRRTARRSIENVKLNDDSAPAIVVRGERVELGGWEDDEYEVDEQAWEDDEVDEPSSEESDEDVDEAEDAPQVVRVRRKGRFGLRGKKSTAAKGPNDTADRDQVMNQLDQASLATDQGDYALPSLESLTVGQDLCFEEQAKEVRRKAKILEKTFSNFGFNVRVVEVETGPVIAQYEVELEAGLRLSKITGLADDLAIALRVPSVRIVAPIPGKNTVGIEVPNESRQIVHLREVMEEASHKADRMSIPLYLGKDVSGNPLIVDMATLPHLLIAGRTGTGKSVCLNAIITSILMTRRPDEVRMLLIDPKMVELSGYGQLPHLMHPVVTDMRKAEAILAWAVEKMEERYTLLARAGVRHVSGYNQLTRAKLIKRLAPESPEEEQAIPDRLPYIVIVADEIADLMMTAGKDVEQHIIRLAQKSRAVGIHLILATQKPTVDVITGLIKSNLPARISFQVASRTDSRVVLDEMGAERLLGNGDMLFLWPGTSSLLRGQGTYVSDDEITHIVNSVSTGEQSFVNELVTMSVENPGDPSPESLRKRDELYEQAIEIVVREQRGSVSLLQRCLGIGYGRAARLIDFMAEDGIVGEYAGSQAREVMITAADWENLQAQEAADSIASSSTTILPMSKPTSAEDAETDWEDEKLDEETEEEEEWEEEEVAYTEDKNEEEEYEVEADAEEEEWEEEETEEDEDEEAEEGEADEEEWEEEEVAYTEDDNDEYVEIA